MFLSSIEHFPIADVAAQSSKVLFNALILNKFELVMKI